MTGSDPSAPLSAEQIFQMAVTAHGGGLLPRAIELYDLLLGHFPDHPILLVRRGVIAREVGDKPGAVTFLRRAAIQSPADAEVLSNLGNALGDLDDPEAETAHLKAAALAPGHIGVLLNAAGHLVRLNKIAESSPLLERALALAPTDPTAWGLIADGLKALGRVEDALAATRRALELAPNDAPRWFNLGVLLHIDGAFAQAADAFRKVLALRPDHPPALTNLAGALLDDPEALVLHERAMALAPDLLEPVLNRAILQMTMGVWREGWRGWEVRHVQKPGPHAGRPEPLWTGDPLASDQPLFIWSELGLGDVILFLRYLPAVRALAPDVTLELHPGLGALAHALPAGVKSYERGAPPPPFSRHLPIGSLPRVIPNFPDPGPYLTPPPERVEAWARRLAGDGPSVGLVWAGQPEHMNDRLRSRRLDDFAPLLKHAGVRFYSLQVGAGRDQLATAPGRIVDLADALPDFGETAAALSQMDLLISVDTSVLNLAGALGRTAWGLIAPNPDWRWGFKGETSFWYPTLRLFRRGLGPSGDAEPVEAMMTRLEAAFAEWLN